MCPSSGEITAFLRHLVFVILCGWLSGMQGGIPPCIPDSHPYRITSTKCHINTVVSPDDGHIVTQNVQRKEINVLRKIVHQVGFIYKIKYGLTCFLNGGGEWNIFMLVHKQKCKLEGKSRPGGTDRKPKILDIRDVSKWPCS